MPKVLFGWELGGGIGHLTKLLPVAKGLADRCEPVFAVKNLGRAARLLADQGDMLSAATLLPAPTWPVLTDPKVIQAPAFTLADIMAKNHFHDPAVLYGVVRGWRGILRLVEPALVVADYSPSLLLAARGSVPTVALGTGYTTPPGGRPLPPIRPWATELPASSQAAERQIMIAVNEVQGRLGRPPVAFLGDLFNGDRTFTCTIPEFDPYNGYRDAPLLPPLNVPAFGSVGPVGTRPTGRVFAYLPANNPHLLTTLEALRSLRLNGDVYVSGLPETIRSRFASATLAFHDRPLDLDHVLPKARVVIHHGGHAMCCAALKAGVPQLLLVNNLERMVTSYGLDQLGCAVILNADGKLDVDSMIGYLRRLLEKEEIHRAAHDTAQRLATQSSDKSVKSILDACADLLA